jgi:hypothetical protein
MSISTVLPSATAEPSTLPSTLDSTVVYHGSHVIEEGGSHTINATVKIAGIEEVHVKSPSGILIGGQLPQTGCDHEQDGSFNAGMTNSTKKSSLHLPHRLDKAKKGSSTSSQIWLSSLQVLALMLKSVILLIANMTEGMDDNGSYIIKDNGCINQRP